MMIHRTIDLFSIASSVITQLSMIINPPFGHYANVSVEYTFYTPEFPPVKFHNLNETQLPLDPKRDLKVLIHGTNLTDAAGWYPLITDEYLKAGIYNVLAINLSQSIQDMSEVKALMSSRYFGNFIGDFLIRLSKDYSIGLEKVHVLAHEIGAHFAGVAGERVYMQTGDRLGRITGLDPYTDSLSSLESGRLSQHDAKLVESVQVDENCWSTNEAKATYLFNWHSYMCNYNEYKAVRYPAARIFAKTINGNGIKVRKCVKAEWWESDCKLKYEEFGEHVGRKTFGVYMLVKGAKEGEICDMLGVGRSKEYNSEEGEL